ncbi:MAG: hypothetical protein V4490_07050, partial [Pseudomonadota bacterium]
IDAMKNLGVLRCQGAQSGFYVKPEKITKVLAVLGVQVIGDIFCDDMDGYIAHMTQEMFAALQSIDKTLGQKVANEKITSLPQEVQDSLNPLSGEPAVYSWVMNESTLGKVKAYQAKLAAEQQGDSSVIPPSSGLSLDENLKGQDIARMPVDAFIQAMVNSKIPKLFAERSWHIELDGKRCWTDEEFALLADIGCHIPVTIFDDGAWGEPGATNVNPAFTGHLLYASGSLLKNKNDDKCIGKPKGDGRYGAPDRIEVVDENGGDPFIKQDAYNAMIERRLLPMLLQANAIAAAEGAEAIFNLPGMGCGVFGGEFEDGRAAKSLNIAIDVMLQKHYAKLQNVRLVVLDAYDRVPEVEPTAGFTPTDKPREYRKNIGHLSYVCCGTRDPATKKSTRPQLSHPSKFVEQFGLDPTKKYIAVKGVGGDPLSYPNNDYFKENTRTTDDGTVGASTDSMYALMGAQGEYRVVGTLGKYFPPAGFADWNAVHAAHKVKLSATKDNILIAKNDGTIQTLGQVLGVTNTHSDVHLVKPNHVVRPVEPPKPVVATEQSTSVPKKTQGSVFAVIISRLAFPFVWIAYLLSTDPQGRSAYDRAVDWMHRFVSGNSNEVVVPNTAGVPPKGMASEPAPTTPSATIHSQKAGMSGVAAVNNSHPTPPASRPGQS